ncbi:uncharacterized protein LOC113296281 [Papaver somniferum]|uniref:uncharacterized protein LOC113296281 n=1 Tax=Papaver somniferum TaxID=3469 RepID=UPI000E6F9DCD|nr:uncharacterized protein LOC113296281 [Papaver somniferum]
MKILKGKEEWIVANQVLIIQEWFPDFNPVTQRTSHVMVWVKFPGLCVELLTEKSLMPIGKILGNPIIVDDRTLNHEYGYFASVLTDIDFSVEVPNETNLVSGGRRFTQEVDIPKKPKFCSHCKIIGHEFKDCKVAIKVINSELGFVDEDKRVNTEEDEFLVESDEDSIDGSIGSQDWDTMAADILDNFFLLLSNKMNIDKEDDEDDDVAAAVEEDELMALLLFAVVDDEDD